MEPGVLSRFPSRPWKVETIVSEAAVLCVQPHLVFEMGIFWLNTGGVSSRWWPFCWLEWNIRRYQEITTSFCCRLNHSLSQIPELECRGVKCNLIFEVHTQELASGFYHIPSLDKEFPLLMVFCLVFLYNFKTWSCIQWAVWCVKRPCSILLFLWMSLSQERSICSLFFRLESGWDCLTVVVFFNKKTPKVTDKICKWGCSCL